METKQVPIKPAFSFGWQSVKKDFWYFVGISIIVTLLSSIGKADDKNIIFQIIGFLISIWLMCGVIPLTLDYVRGTKREMSKIFTETKLFFRILGATIILGIIFVLGIIALIIPGIYLILRYQFVIFLILDKNMSIKEAMKESTNMTKDIKWKLLKFILATGGVCLLGLIALFVGIFVAIPVIWLAQAFLYNSLLQKPTETPNQIPVTN